jgi:Phosphoenolpyruvate phosphomutase
MRNLSTAFRQLRNDPQPLCLAIAWDTGSARLIESLGASAIATTGAGVSWALGYPDGSFPILDDKDGDVALAFGIGWTSAYLQSLYDQFSAEQTGFNPERSWVVPMQARYVIGPDNVIAYAEISSDYHQRPEPSKILPVLRSLKTGGTP